MMTLQLESSHQPKEEATLPPNVLTHEALRQKYNGEAFGLTQRMIAQYALAQSVIAKSEHPEIHEMPLADVRERMTKQIQREFVDGHLGDVTLSEPPTGEAEAQTYIEESLKTLEEYKEQPAIKSDEDIELASSAPLEATPAHITKIPEQLMPLEDQWIKERFSQMVAQVRKIGGKTLDAVLNTNVLIQSSEIPLPPTGAIRTVVTSE